MTPPSPYDGDTFPAELGRSAALRRHDLVYVSASAWRTLLHSRGDLAAEPLIAGWVACAWPLVARRALPGEAPGLALGLPLPPSHGKRRVVLSLPYDALVSSAPPPLLRDVTRAAPSAWRPTLERLIALDGEIRIYGSLAWQYLTGLDYLTLRSDLDLLLPLPRPADAPRVIAGLAALERGAPMRLDGELVRGDGAAVNWREIREGAAEVLVKTRRDALLLETRRFLDGAQS
jgi:phosphoribosyl-dephospho-CoA transferase